MSCLLVGLANSWEINVLAVLGTIKYYQIMFPQVALLCPQICKTDEQGCKDPWCVAVLFYITSFKHGGQWVRGALIFKDVQKCNFVMFHLLSCLAHD